MAIALQKKYQMVQNSPSPIVDSLLGSPDAPLLLKVKGTERDGQILKLNRQKCVIGSANNCTLRLQAAGVSPYHCLVMRGANGVVLQRFDKDTRVNGESLAQSVLLPGDVLGVGSLELEILPSEGTVPRENQLPSQHKQELPQVDSSATQKKIEAIQDRLQGLRSRNRQRIQKLIAQLRSTRSELKSLNQTSSDSETELVCKLTESLQETELREQNLQQLSKQTEQKVEELSRQLETLQQELESATAANSELEEEVKSLKEFTVDAERQILRLEENRNQERQLLEEEIGRLNSQINQPTEPVAEEVPESVVEDTPADPQPELPVVTELFAKEETPASEQECVADVLAKFGYQPDADEDSEEAAASGEPEPPAPFIEPAKAEAPTEATAEEDEVSIDDYMSQLLNRLKTNEHSPSADQAPKALKEAEETTQQAVTEESTVTENDFKASFDEEKNAMFYMIPSCDAPENTSDIRKLRELANDFAKDTVNHAISKNRVERWKKLAQGKAMVCFTTLICGICLNIYSDNYLDISFLGACVGYLLATFWGLQALVVVKHIQTAERKLKNSDSEVESEEATPVSENDSSDLVQVGGPEED